MDAKNNNNSGSSGSNDELERIRDHEAKRETFRIIREMAEILNCGLRGNSLGSSIRLIEDGADPVALANLVKRWRSEKTTSSNGNT